MSTITLGSCSSANAMDDRQQLADTFVHIVRVSSELFGNDGCLLRGRGSMLIAPSDLVDAVGEQRRARAQVRGHPPGAVGAEKA